MPAGSSARPPAAAQLSEPLHPERVPHHPPTHCPGQGHPKPAPDNPPRRGRGPSTGPGDGTGLRATFIRWGHTERVPAALKPRVKPLLLSWSRALPKTSTKCCCLEIFPGTPRFLSGAKRSPGRGQKRFVPVPRCEPDAVPACDSPVLPRDAPGRGARGRRLAPHPHQQPPASARPGRSGEAELRGVCPAPAQGTELAIVPRAWPFQGGFAGIQRPANPADERAEDGGAEDDEDPGVDDGVHGEEPQGAEVSVLVEIGGEGPHVCPDLSKNERNREK